MVSYWLKTQKKPPRTNQIRAVLTTKFSKIAMVFSRRRRDLICTQNNNRKVKNIFEKSEHTLKSTPFWLENVVLRDKYCQKNQGK